jgi:hypothetical protein
VMKSCMRWWAASTWRALAQVCAAIT